MKSILYIAALAAMSAFTVSCTDDLAGNFSWSDGDGSLSMDVGFTSFGTALDTRATGGTPGDAIDEVNDLQVLFYSNVDAKDDPGKETGDLKYVFKGTPTDGGGGSDKADFTFTREDKERNPNTDSPTTGSMSGTSTRHMTFQLNNVERGNYRIYVVANMPSGFDATRDAGTVNDLRNYPLHWNATDIAANNAMFGYFTASESTTDVINKEAPLIGISGPLSKTQPLHAWIKRAASKVTVAFDGSSLQPEVRIYIKSVQLRDLPRTCSLGAVNTPGNKTVLFPNPDNESEETQLTSYGTITYSSIAGEDRDNVVYREEPYYPDFTGDIENEEQVKTWRQNVHNAENALYFFENCQGTGTHDESDADGTYKPQTDSNGNKLPDDYDHDYQKDSKDYGTYVEVHAYYENNNLDNRTSGNIIYRFMLGKDVETDFNAERSIHYKLTLKFNGYANDVDWHIDYNDAPGNHTPETIYVSYNYNTPSILPFQYVGEKRVAYLAATITQNNWGPDDNSISHFTGTPNPDGLGKGFLSLRYDPNVRIGTGGSGETNETFRRNEDAPKVKAYWDLKKTNEQQTYLEDFEESNKLDLNNVGVDDDYKFGVTYRQNSNGYFVTSVNIPLYTRPLMIYKSTSYTGANPYYTTTRSATVRLTYRLEGETANQTMDVHIEQVHRIDNPSGIWRRSNNTDPFAVTLMQQTGPEAYSRAGVALTGRAYKPYQSQGSWRAYIYKAIGADGETLDDGDVSWFTLTAGNQRADAIGEYIQGLKGTNISFTYKPNETIGDTQVRCGIIKVEYNDYTCTHMILVRQGYAPLQISDVANAPKWHTFNLYDSNEEVNHPCDAGSLFVRGSYTPSILDDQSPNNTGDMSNTRNLFGTGVASLNTTAGGTYQISSNSGNNGRSTTYDFQATAVTLSENNHTYNSSLNGYMPTYLQYGTLKDASNTRVTIDKLYGVLYADGAITTATDFNTATGCLHRDVRDGKTEKGIRGAFAYNSNDARQVFFPIGATGFGRRKYNGSLQYAFGDTYYSTSIDWTNAPLLNSLYFNEGAIYWMRAYATQAQTGSTHDEGDNAWDINYKTYDFDFMDADNGQNDRSLSLIRLVDN